MLASPTLMKTSGIFGSSQEPDPDTTPTCVYLPFSFTCSGPPESPLHVPCLLGAPSGVPAHISVLINLFVAPYASLQNLLVSILTFASFKTLDTEPDSVLPHPVVTASWPA